MTKQERRILITVCLGTLLFFNSFTSINIALPAIQREFGISLAVAQWVSILGVVMMSTLSLCFGRAGDIIGRRKLYRAGIILYTLGSGLAATSGSIVQLLIFRGIMAVGLAMAAPLSAAILASNFVPERRGWALGLYASAGSIGRAIGPTIGGILLYYYSWRAIFLMNFLVGFCVSVAVFMVLKGEDARYPEPFDFIGTAALLIAYPSLLIALSLGAGSQWTGWIIHVCFLIAAVGTASFVWIESRVQKPLINPYLFRNLAFSGALISLTLFSATHSPIVIVGPLYMENVLGLSTAFVGLVMSALPVFTALSSPLSGRLADRFNSMYVALLGMAFLLVGIWLYAHLGTKDHYAWVAVSFAFIGTGIGLFTPANQRMAFSAIGQEHYGIVSAMIASIYTGAGTLGITVTVAFLERMMGGKGFDNPAIFVSAQRFAFLMLLLLTVVGIVILFSSGRKRIRKGKTLISPSGEGGSPPQADKP